MPRALFFVLLLLLPAMAEGIPYNTPVVDGQIVVSEDDWDEDDLAGSNADLPGVPVGDLEAVWLTWDVDSLYVGIEGLVLWGDAPGRLAFVIDTDFGSSTGRSDFGDRFQLGGAAMEWVVRTPGFGSDFLGSIRGDQNQVALYKTPGTSTPSVVSNSEFRQATTSAVPGDSLRVLEIALPWTLIYPNEGGGVVVGAEIGLTAALLINSSRPPQKLTDDILPSRTEQGTEFFYDAEEDTLWTDTVVQIAVDANNDGVPDTQKGQGTITGTILFDDLSAPPYPSVEVSAFELPDGVEPFRMAMSNTADGVYLLEELTDGESFRLDFTHPGYEPGSVDSVFIPPDDPAVGLDPVILTAYTGSISGTLLPRTVVAWVVAEREGAPIDSVLTDGSTGDYQVLHLNTGTYDIRVTPVTTCYVGGLLESIDVVNGVDTAADDVALTPFGSIGGTVSPTTELVTLEAVRGDSVFAQIQTSGTYRLSCLPSGFYDVRLIPDNPEFADAQRDSVEVFDGQETSGIDFTLLGVSTWRFAADPVGDDHGPNHLVDPSGRLVLIDWAGNHVYEDRSSVPDDLIPLLEPVDGLYYIYPTSLAFPRSSHDIYSFEVKDRDTALEFVITVGAVPDPANPEPYDYASWVGFLEEDAKILLQQISIYIDSGPGGSIRGLPWRGHDISEWDAWEYALAISGWWKGVIHSNGFSLRENYTVYKTDLDIDLYADHENGIISAKVPKSLLGSPTEEEFDEWDILVVLCGHDCCDDDLNLGAIRWVEGAFSPEWRFQGGRSGSEGTWDGKQDPNVVDFLPLPGLGHDLPDSLAGEMMDYTRPHNRARIETDEYPVRLAASRFEDRQAPEMDFAEYFGFTAGTEANPDWSRTDYAEEQGVMDINLVDAYGAGSAAFLTGTVGASFQKAIWRDRPGWYDVRVRSLARGQTMNLLISPGSSLSPALTDTNAVTLPGGGAWIDTVWTAAYLQQGFNMFRFEYAQGLQGDASDGMVLLPTVPPGDSPLNLQIALLSNTDRITIRTGIMDNMGFQDYIDAWLVYRLPGGDTLRVALGEEEGSNEWLADIEVEGLDTLTFHFELKDNAGPLNPEPSVDNFSAYPRLTPEIPLTPSVRDSLLAAGGQDSSLFFYRIPVVEIERFEATEIGWTPRRKNFRSPDGSKVIIDRGAVPDDVEGLTVTVAAVNPDSIQSLGFSVDRGTLRSIGVARDIHVADLTGERITAFETPVQISIHYQLPEELDGQVVEDDLVLYRWEPQTSRWVFVGGRVNPGARTILAQVQQLAGRYAVFEDRALGRDTSEFITGISFTPNPFSPNGDGIYDELRVSYYLWANATITIDIYDMSGHEVNNFVFEETGSPGEALGHEWDGRDKNGELVPYGIYIVRFRAVDESEFLYRFNKAVAVIR